MNPDNRNEVSLLTDIINSWEGDDILLVQVMNSPFLDNLYKVEDQFILKKFLGGELKSSNIYQLMFACNFNKARIITNIHKVTCIDKDNHYIINSTNKRNSIINHIINRSKGGVFRDKNHG